MCFGAFEGGEACERGEGGHSYIVHLKLPDLRALLLTFAFHVNAYYGSRLNGIG